MTTTALNNWNAIAFTINVICVFGSQSQHLKLGMKDNATLSKKYQTLITPSGYAFAIWGIIYFAEFGFIVAQLFFPATRTNTFFVTDIVGYNFIYACFAQSVWSICFGYEYITASFICMIAILGSLLPIVSKIFTRTTTANNFDTDDYSWLWNEFPIEIHCGWIMAASLVNMNVLLVSYHVSSKVQIISAYITLGIILFCGTFFSVLIFFFGRSTSNNNKLSFVVIPCVMAWASIAISKELNSPNESIVTNFSPDIINSIKILSKLIGYFILFCVGISFVFGN
jgi:benzodiazapine receptor